MMIKKKPEVYLYDHRRKIGMGSCLSRIAYQKNAWMIETNRSDINEIKAKLADLPYIENVSIIKVKHSRDNNEAIRFETRAFPLMLAGAVAKVLEDNFDEVDWAPIDYTQAD